MVAGNRQNRIASVDFWRGVALATIFINHVPGNPLESLTHKNFGFSDAAEAFVFLAGIGVAFAYAARVQVDGFARPVGSILLRIWQLYMAHLTVLIACAAVVSFAVLSTNDIRLLEATQFDQIVESPMEALIGIATLGLQPAYLNILPLYIAMMLLAPALISLALVDGRLALFGAGLLYVATQLLHLKLPSYPGADAWYFNPLAWQLLFTIGLVCGLRTRRGPARTSRVLLWGAAALLLGSLVWVRTGYNFDGDLSPLPRFMWDFDKAQLTLPRLLHALALFYVVSRLSIEGWLSRSALAAPLLLMGRHSLPVFCVGTVLSIGAQVFRMGAERGAAVDFLLVALGLMLQIGLATGLEWHRNGLGTRKAREESRQSA
ncbi:OpgC domain-containing protein [Alsobacter sp. SYSU M60028]|uniref:OpgC domain-containing protein n=1 Tax=Alsobacter ponti TaxID=2962936 RepID=A0ABT1L7S8_9HYPH|nr:OpgC domain-containing protein [Alsobacter ponti]MCP8937546.1 OpgC domain-containing protein [Alsobacter ponti]